MKIIKSAKFYLVFALLVVGYYTYAALNGISFWESSNVTRNTEYNSGSRVRGAHAFYHK